MFSREKEEWIEKQFHAKMQKVPNQVVEEIVNQIGCQDVDTSIALKYMYGNMPLSDIGNYTFEDLLDFAKHGIFLWKECPWVTDTISEELFLNYVLFHRVNTEEIEPCRTLFYNALKKEVVNKTPKEIVIAVNYWCAKEATYQSSDDRTLSALAVYKTASGRCGEESVFLTNALRSVGIPARQVYAPKWSHCDDNHAWVEVYVEGKWQFLGACEPEEVLNKGWFNHAASRAMVIQSKWFERDHNEEECVDRDGMVTMRNQTSRYAHTKKIKICVQDEMGRPVERAKIACQIINYATLVSLASGITNEEGQLELTLGLGTIVIRAEKDGTFTEVLFDTRNQETCMLILTKILAVEKEIDFDIIAPVDAPVNPGNISEEQKIEGYKKLEQATKERLKKVATLKNGELERFLDKIDRLQHLRKQCVDTLSKKDLRDCKETVLEDHVTHVTAEEGRYPDEIFRKYVLCPRIQYEPLTKYRAFIQSLFTEEQKLAFQREVPLIWHYISMHIEEKHEEEYGELITTPAACLKLQAGSLLSKKILFVAIARSLGIAARLNPINEYIEYWKEGSFLAVEDHAAREAVLHISSESTDVDWNYFGNWSLSKLEEGWYVPLHLEACKWQDGKLQVEVAAGTYRLITSNRLPNGNIFAKQYGFTIGQQEEKHIVLALRETHLNDMLEEILLPEFSVKTEDDRVIKGSELTKESKSLLMFLEESKEPTEHILNELIEQREKFGCLKEKIAFIIRSSKALEDPTLSKCLKAVPNVEIYYDDFKEIINILGRRMYVDPEKLPLIIVTKGTLKGIYATSGYNVGTANLLLQIMKEVAV